MNPLITELQSFFSALSDATRLEIVLFLLNKDEGATVQEISSSLERSQPLISHHLACLRNCGIVKAERRGKFVFYSLNGKEIRDIISIAIKHSKEHSKSILACDIVKEEKLVTRDTV